MSGSKGPARSSGAARSRSRHGSGAGSQGGFSLIEILVCVALVGTVILALAAGMLTLAKTSRATTQRQQIQLALGSYTESLKASPYLTCTANQAVPGATEYAADYGSWAPRWAPTKPGMTAQVLSVEYWSETGGPNGGFVATCPATGDQATQRLTVRVDWQGRSGTAQVVKAFRGTTP